jgi:electron transport complex protein RnfG
VLKKHMSRSALLLGLFALVGTAIVAVVFTGTEEPIADAERAYMLRSLHSVIKPELHDNDIFTDHIEVQSKDYLGTDKPVSIFRARKNGLPTALAITTIARQGYVGPIKLLVGIDLQGTVIGVRVLTHRETPGLGDAIDEKRSDWIFGFDGHSLDNPESKDWRVRRDGGFFDQFTGATITPRAVVKAVHDTLKYFEKNKEQLFTKKSIIQKKVKE